MKGATTMGFGRKVDLQHHGVTGVYMIKDKTEGKIYIGESFDIYRRWEQHKDDLVSHTHRNYPLQRLYDEYGMDNFEFTILHRVENQPCDEITKLYLLYLEEKEIQKIEYHANRCNVEGKRNVFLKTNCHLVDNKIFEKDKRHYERIYNYCNKKKISILDIRNVWDNFNEWEKKVAAKEDNKNEKKRVKQAFEQFTYDNHDKVCTVEEFYELLKDIRRDVEKLNLINKSLNYGYTHYNRDTQLYTICNYRRSLELKREEERK